MRQSECRPMCVMCEMCLHVLLNLRHALRELLPVVHDHLGLALLGDGIGHLLHLLFAFFNLVDADIGDQGDAGAHACRGTRLRVFNGQGLLRLDAELLAGVEVYGRVGLGGRRVQRTGSRVHLVFAEETEQVGLLQGCQDTRLGRGRDDSHRVTLLLSPLELLRHAGALGAFLAELLGDLAQLPSDVVLTLLITHGEVVLLLQTDEHVAEVVAHKVLQERIGVVAGVNLVLLQHLVGEIRTCLERQTLRLAERVVAVEQDILDLEAWSAFDRSPTSSARTPCCC